MTISRIKGNGRTRQTVYSVYDNDGHLIARFRTLESAALVVRYIAGGNLPEAEALRAVEIMKTEDELRNEKNQAD